MKHAITIAQVIDYLGQFDRNDEVVLMDDDTPVRTKGDPDDDSSLGEYVSLETMFEQFNDMVDSDKVEYKNLT